jgi:DNA topoisomerase IA
MIATAAGFEVTQILERHCPTVISTTLTRELEKNMNAIQEHRPKKEEVLA